MPARLKDLCALGLILAALSLPFVACFAFGALAAVLF